MGLLGRLVPAETADFRFCRCGGICCHNSCILDNWRIGLADRTRCLGVGDRRTWKTDGDMRCRVSELYLHVLLRERQGLIYVPRMFKPIYPKKVNYSRGMRVFDHVRAIRGHPSEIGGRSKSEVSVETPRAI